MTDPKLRVLISSEQIQNRIRELGEKISADYPTGNLHMICILKGAVFFMTDNLLELVLLKLNQS